MSDTVKCGYLARVEANFVGVRAAPGVVFLRLTRSFESEGQVTSMFTEMTPAEASRLINELQAALDSALASESEGNARIPRPLKARRR